MGSNGLLWYFWAYFFAIDLDLRKPHEKPQRDKDYPTHVELITREYFDKELMARENNQDSINPKAFTYFQTPDRPRNHKKRLLTARTEQNIMNDIVGEFSRFRTKTGKVDIDDVI